MTAKTKQILKNASRLPARERASLSGFLFSRLNPVNMSERLDKNWIRETKEAIINANKNKREKVSLILESLLNKKMKER